MPLPFEAHSVVAFFLHECNNVPKSTTTQHWLVARVSPTLARVSPALGWLWILQQPVLSSVRWLLEWAPNTEGFLTMVPKKLRTDQITFCKTVSFSC
jgi:hypothetical protein